MLAYLDTSCLVAVAFQEPGSGRLAEHLSGYDRLISSNLLEAEFRSALLREGVREGEALLSWVSWLHPDRSLAEELRQVLDFGYLRGADLWHLGCALFLRRELSDLVFLTLDQRQEQVALSLGFEGLDDSVSVGG